MPDTKNQYINLFCLFLGLVILAVSWMPIYCAYTYFMELGIPIAHLLFNSVVIALLIPLSIALFCYGIFVTLCSLAAVVRCAEVSEELNQD